MFYSFGNRDICINFNNIIYFKRLPERLIFNFDYVINNNGAEYPDYIYVDHYESSDLDFMTTTWFNKHFMKITDNIWLRIDKIASFKYKDGKVIYNMAIAQNHRFVKRGGQPSQQVVSSIFLYENATHERYNEIVRTVNQVYAKR